MPDKLIAINTDDRTWIETEPLVGWDVLHEEAGAVTLEGAEEVPPAK